MDDVFADVMGSFVSLAGGKRAYVAVPAGGETHRGVLVIQEAFGVNEYIESETRRLAAAGYVAIAPDLFDGTTLAYDDRGAAAEALKTRSDETMLAYLEAACDHLDAQPNVERGGYGVVGFCMGGRLAFLTAAALGERIAAAVAFYGGGIAPDVAKRRPSLVDRAGDLRAPLLLIYGADDASIPPSEHGRLAQALSEAKRRYSLEVYPNAPHGFACRVRESYRPEIAEIAWTRALAMLATCL